MRYFESQNRLTSDDCAVLAKDRENQSIIDYETYNFFNNGNCEETDKKLMDLAMEHPNLRFRNGYGSANACTIDLETQIKYEPRALTHGPERRQYRVRNFTAVPDISRGPLAPNFESMLMPGEDTHTIRQCDRVTEKDFQRFVPYLDCIEKFITLESQAIPEMQTIGVNSRDLVRDQMKQKKNKICL